MRRAASFLLPLAFTLAVMGSCTDKPDADACDDLCLRAGDCSVFPSPLGIGDTLAEQIANCEARCELSDDEISDAVRACGDEEDYPTCSALQSCLEQAAGFGVLGKGEVRLRLEVARDEAYDCDVPGTGGQGGGGGQGSGEGGAGDPGQAIGAAGNFGEGGAAGSPDLMVGWCEEAGVSVIVPFVDTLQQRFYGEASNCTYSPEGDFLVRDVPAGNVDRVGVEFRSVVDADGGSGFCAAASLSSTQQTVEVVSGDSVQARLPIMVPAAGDFTCLVASNQAEACQSAAP